VKEIVRMNEDERRSGDFAGDGEMREALFQMMQGPGRVHSLLLALRDVCRDLAETERHCREREFKAVTWQKLARRMDLAANASLPLIAIGE
jgi:hypothetical protein